MNVSSATKRFIHRWFVIGKLRYLAAPLYALVIALELTIIRLTDSLTKTRRQNGRQLTAVIKTFERPQVVARLVKSIRRSYPQLKIIIADDSHTPIQIPGAQTIGMPYESGVSAGRNEALRHVLTDYVLILDDDFVFYRHTDLAKAVTIMETYPQIDILGGAVVDLPFFATRAYTDAALYPTEAAATLPAGSFIGGLPVYDKVAQFFIGRTISLKKVLWDPQLKKIDHADFFTRAKGVLTTVYNADLKCLHARTPFNADYMQKRNDTAVDQAVLAYKYRQAAGESDSQQG